MNKNCRFLIVYFTIVTGKTTYKNKLYGMYLVVPKNHVGQVFHISGCTKTHGCSSLPRKVRQVGPGWKENLDPEVQANADTDWTQLLQQIFAPD